MRKLNLLFTLYSLDVLLIIIERLSFTTQILLQPFGFIRLHELIQGPILLTISLIIPVFIIREITNNFSTLKTNKGFYLLTLFIVGAYIYGLGEGWHEVASFTFNQHCDVKNFMDDLCGGLFINDYYTGNILFYIGAIPMNLAILLLEKMNPGKAWDNKSLLILFINATVYAFTHFAYAAFDRVLVGLYSLIILLIISAVIFFSVRKNWRQYPYITYSMFAYSLAFIGSLAVRVLR